MYFGIEIKCMGSFKKYIKVGGGWVCGNFVTNVYENYRGWGVKLRLLCNTKFRAVFSFFDECFLKILK